MQKREIASQDFLDVKAFYEKFNIPHHTTPTLLDPETFVFRMRRLQEEVVEFDEAYNTRDLAGAADALIDLVYIAMGTAINMGLPWDALWAEVQRANMEKVRAQRPEDSKHGTTLDIIKPLFWQAPDHRLALGIAPFDHVVIGIDGNAAFALVGEDLQTGEAEFVVMDEEFYERWSDRSDNERAQVAMTEARLRLELRLGRSYPLKGEV